VSVLSPEELVEAARCNGEDDTLFNATWFPVAYEALRYCAECPVRLECLDYISPAQNFYSGVAGGMVWSEGRRVRANHKQQVIRDRKHVLDLALHRETLLNLQAARGTITSA
jgi:hypothetical protein